MTKHISLGENCFTQNLLKRYGLSSDAGVFSFVGCNIELINLILDDKFKNFLNQDYYEYATFGGQKCLVNRFYGKEKSHHIRFPHHDIINCKSHNDSFVRKVNRFKDNIKSGNIVFWYNYRYIENDDVDLILSSFREFDNKIGGENRYVIFNQRIDREIKEFNHLKMGKFNIIECFDKNIWHGDSNYDGKTFKEQFDRLMNDYELLKKLN